MVNLQTIVELRDPTLGRIFTRNCNLGAIKEVRKIRDDGTSADEYAARFFAAISRAVPEEAPLNAEAFQAGNGIDYTAVHQLSPDRLDDLCCRVGPSALTDRTSTPSRY